MKITIIEDDLKLAENLAKKLKKNGYILSIFNSKEEFYSNFKYNSDLFIIDINLGGANDGFEIIKWIRNKSITSPIIITSGYSNIEKKVYGLDLGADDYLAKPYSINELRARIRSITRREFQMKKNIINYKDCKFDIKTKSFLSGVDKEIKFSKKDLMIIEMLLINKNKIVSRNNLITSVWGDYDGTGVKDNTINVTLFNLRTKLGNMFNIETIVGEGYILKE